MTRKTNGFEKPNHTQTPNSFFDEILRDIDTMAELKVTLAIIRQTIGWHRKRVCYGIAKIERLTGMARNSVIAGAQAAERRGTIRRLEGAGEAQWELVIDDTPSNLDPSNFEGGAGAEGDPPQSLTENPSTAEGLKRKKEIKKEKEEEIPEKATEGEGSSLSSIWQQVLEQVQPDTPRASFRAYVQPSQAVRYDGNGLTVLAPSEEARAWLESRLTTTAQNLLVGILNHEVRVSFVIAEQASA